MQTRRFEIKPYQDQYRDEILAVWEESVLATHDFLTRDDFHEIRELVQTIDFNHFDVYCATKDDFVLGFLGVADMKIEMLFLRPDYIGQGLGKMLVNFAITELAVDKVDVNEQNEKAVSFYQRFGFETFERTEKDDQGRDYPLLRMKLRANEQFDPSEF